MANAFDLLKFKSTLKPADDKLIAQFSSILPEFILNEWRNRGFANYANGFLITTDPNDFYDIIEGWVDEPEKCHVVMRSAFGSFYYMREGNFFLRGIIHNTSTNLQDDFEVAIEFAISKKDHQNNSLQKDIYDKSIKRLGSPGYDEVYAFVPAIPLGGDYNPDTIQKVKLREYLVFMAQLFE